MSVIGKRLFEASIAIAAPAMRDSDLHSARSVPCCELLVSMSE
jgi:hypothetical protein